MIISLVSIFIFEISSLLKIVYSYIMNELSFWKLNRDIVFFS